MISPASTTLVASMTSTASFYQKNFILKKKNVYFLWFVTFYYLKKAPKSQNLEKKNILRCFANWTIDGVQHWFNKNWLGRRKNGVSQEHTGPLIFKKKNQMYIHKEQNYFAHFAMRYPVVHPCAKCVRTVQLFFS